VRRHVILFLQHYHTPDCPTAARPFSLVQRLAQTHDVTLITSSAWHERRLASSFDWVPSTVRLMEVDAPYRNAMSVFERGCSFARYALAAIGRGFRLRRPDVVFGSSTPLSAAAAAAVVARWHGVPWVFEVRDLWPDFPIQMGAVPSPTARRVLRWAEQALYRSAAHVLALSPDMASHVQRRAPQTPIDTVLYGTDFELLDAVEDREVKRIRADIGGEHILLYAGSFGRANAIPTLLDTARRLDDPSGIRFVFAGGGYHAPEIRSVARSCASVHHMGPLPYPSVLALFRAADLSIVSFADRPVLATNSPGKFFDSLAAGTPVIVTQPGWTADVVEEHHCGWTVPSEDPGALARKIVQLLDTPQDLAEAGRRGAVLARRTYDRRHATNQIIRVLDQVASR
jgi:glycosyltransferase involved in cell wall biosynthesis